MTNTPWESARVEQLKELWLKGLTAGQISNIMDVSRNAVIGKVHRLDLPGRPSPIIGRRRAPAPVPPIALTDCHYPFGNPGEEGFHFCGKPAVIGRPYCTHHVALCYRRKGPADGETI